MAVISRVGVALVLCFIVLPFASSSAAGFKNCSQNEFWSPPNGCCLPHGGPPSPPPPPPKGTMCPPSFYWGNPQGCCVPRHPPPEQGPPPQCPRGWVWNNTVRRCEPVPTPPKPNPPKPSHYHGGNHGHDGNHDNNGHGKYRRGQLKSRSAPLCPTGLDACPILGGAGNDYECVDTSRELNSCGGCPSLGSGQDCTAIEGVWNVGCEQGRCKVYTCAAHYKLSQDGKFCVPL